MCNKFKYNPYYLIPVSKMDLANNLNADDVTHRSDNQLVPATDPSGASAQDHRQVAVGQRFSSEPPTAPLHRQRGVPVLPIDDLFDESTLIGFIGEDEAEKYFASTLRHFKRSFLIFKIYFIGNFRIAYVLS